MKVELLNYFDVWGNVEEGFEVNDQSRHELEFPDELEDTDNNIINWLIQEGWIRDDSTNLVDVIDLGDTLEIVESKTGCPLYGLNFILKEDHGN